MGGFASFGPVKVISGRLMDANSSLMSHSQGLCLGSGLILSIPQRLHPCAPCEPLTQPHRRHDSRLRCSLELICGSGRIAGAGIL